VWTRHPGRRVHDRPGADWAWQDHLPAHARRPGQADLGKIIFDGKDLGRCPSPSSVDVRAQNFRLVFQNYNLLPTLTAEENVEAALVPLGIPTAERRSRSVAALTEVGLGDRVGHFPSEMSGGEQHGSPSPERSSRNQR